MRYTRRAVLSIGAASLGASGCASNSLQLVSAGAQALFAPGKHYKYGFSPDEIDGFDYPALGARIGTDTPFILILAESNGDETLWASADHQFFWFRGPRLVRTSGLLVDLAEVSWQDRQDPVAQASSRIRTGTGGTGDDREAASYRGNSLSQMGFVDLNRSDSSPIVSTVKIGGLAHIEINAKQRHTQIIDEHWNATAWRWSTRARFWIDPADGTPWRSIQHYAPAMEAIEFEVIRPSIA